MPVQSEAVSAIQQYTGRLDMLSHHTEQHLDMVRVQILKCQFYERGITFILKLLARLLLGSYCTVKVILETVLGNRILFEVD